MDKALSMHADLSDETLLRLNKINEIKDYFITEIRERESMSTRLSKYVAAFDCIDKTSIVLSVISEGVSISSFVSAIGAPAGIASASFGFVFSLTAGIVRKFLKTPRNKKKHNNIVMLARSKLSSTETSISQALIDSNISHKEYITIINEEDKYRRMKEDVIRMKKDELHKVKKIKINKIIKQNSGHS